MPIITIVTNASASLELKRQLIQALTVAFSEAIKCAGEHVHVHILDSQCFAFGGDYDTPAASITVKATALQIWPEVRKTLVERMIPVLQESLAIAPDRTTTMFEELPVENIAVGTNISVFLKSPRGSLSPHDNAPEKANIFTTARK